MIPFATTEPVRVVAVREWERNGQTMRTVRVCRDSTPDEEGTELYVAPGVDRVPVEGELVHLVYAARSRGWETLVNEQTGERRRRNAGTAHSVREFIRVDAP